MPRRVRLKMPAGRKENCMANVRISAICRLVTWRRPQRGGATGDGAVRSVTKLVGDVETQVLAFIAGSQTEKMLVHVRRDRKVMSIRHGVLVEDVSRADVPAIVKVARDAQFIIPTGLPV